MLFASATARGAAHAAANGESTPLHLGGAAGQGAHVGGGGGSLIRTIVGLAIVIGVIYGVAWVLKQVKAGKQERATGAGLASIASAPLGSGRSVHLVKAGRELVLVGVGEHGVTPLRAYDEAQARAAGLIDEDGALLLPTGPSATTKTTTTALPAPKPRLALPAPGRRLTLEGLRAMTVRR